MPALSINVPFPVFQDRDGQPLDNGYVYIGTPYLDPQTNPVQVYFDEALTILAAQPLRTINGYVSNAGTPAQLYVNGVNFSIKVLDSKANLVYSFQDGSGISPNAAGVQYDPAGAGAVSTTVQAKLRETVSVKDFGAVGDGLTNDTVAIQTAINSGKSLFFPDGTYLASGLTQSTDNQRFLGQNSIIKKNANGVLFSSTGRGVSLKDLYFDGIVAFTGNCAEFSGDNIVVENCVFRTQNGNAFTCTGAGARISNCNDAWASNDAAGYGIVLGDGITGKNYYEIVNITTSTSAVLLRKAFTVGITNCQIGGLDATDGQAYVANTRIVGDYTAKSSFNVVTNCSISGNVTIGDGVTTISGIGFGPNVAMAAGKTITVNKMRESHIDIINLGNVGVTIVDNLTGNVADIGNSVFFPPIAYTPVWRAITTDPVIGNGSISGFYTRMGTQINTVIDVTMGSTTTYGTGTWYFTLKSPQKNFFGGFVQGEDSGTGYIYGSVIGGGPAFGNGIRIKSDASSSQWAATVPITWATGDNFRLNTTYTVNNT